MCKRISLVAPTTADLDALVSWADECGVGIQRLSGWEGRWRDASILVTRTYCDCGSPIGSLTGSGPEHDPERTGRALRRRGWSEAKMARWIGQRKVAAERREAARAAAAGVALDAWVTFFKGAPSRGHLRSIGIFYREDGRPMAPTDLAGARRETRVLAILEPVVLARLELGVLHEFSASSTIRG